MIDDYKSTFEYLPTFKDDFQSVQHTLKSLFN